MAHTPHTWTTGEVIPAATLNAIETDLAAATNRANHTGTQAASTVTGLSTVATSGAYTDLSGKPTIPAAYTDAQAVSANAAGLAAKANIADVGAAGTATGDALRAAYAPINGNVRQNRGTPVAIGGYVTSASSQQSSTGTARVPYYITTATTDLRLVYAAWILSGINDADSTSGLTLSASVEYSGNIYRVTFGGATTVTVSPGGHIASDVLPLDLPAGALIYVRTFTSGANWYGNRAANASGFGGFTATTDLTAPGSGAIADATSFQNLIGPATILGSPLKATGLPPAVLGVGDSIMWGYGDQAGTGVGGVNTTNQNLGFGGFVARAANTLGFGLCNIGVANDTAQNFLTQAGHFRRMFLASLCSTAICDYGRNDVTGGRSLAQVQADLLAVWTMLANRRLRVFQTTITPRTTSTDLWQTTTGQTVGTGEAVRTQLNDWLRAGAPISAGAAVAVGTGGALLAGQSGHPLYGYFETADQVETARNSGLWKAAANVRTTADGAFASGTSITSATANFTNADQGRTITLAGAGAAGAMYQGKIKSVTNATTAVVITAPATVVSNAALTVGDYYTQDGIHPEPVGHALMASAITGTNLA